MINVIIPAYNCSATLDRTLGSLVAQTDKDFITTIVDDCSTENLVPIIDRYKDILNIRYIRNPENVGCGMSRQVGIDNTDQKFITFLDSDDMFMPYAVETFNSVVKANPDIEYLHTQFYEQLEFDGETTLCLRTDNYTACHGKLYNVESLKKYNIRNSPEVIWADDSYFNSMCNAFMPITKAKVTTLFWSCNKNSVLRKPNAERDKKQVYDFLNAMYLSAQFIVENGGSLQYLKPNVLDFPNRYKNLRGKELALLNKLLNYIRRKS